MPPWSKRSGLFAEDLRYTAKTKARSLHNTIEFWFRKKYGLTIHDPRYLDSTVEEMLTDYWAHTFYDDPKALDDAEDFDFEIDSVADEIGYQPDEWEDLT